MSIVSRISTYSVFNNTLRDVNTTQANLFDLQKQISSGLKTDTFAGLAGQVEQFTFLEAKIEKAKTYEENNEVAVSRLKTANVSMDQILQYADELEDLIVLARNPAIEEDIAFKTQLDQKIKGIAAELNSSFEGKYLFGGTRSNVQPVITEPSVPATLDIGVPDAGYYQGSQEDVQVRASDSVTLTPNIRADNVAFQKLFAAANQALTGYVAEQDSMLADAQDLVQSAIQDIIAVQADNNANILSLEDINTRHEDLRLYWQGVTEEVSKTDLVSASTQVAVDQAVLQATFQSFAAVNQLRLSDYL